MRYTLGYHRERGERMSPYAHERPSGGFELAAWLFMRVSGVALLILALGHLVIMHLVNSVEVIDYDFVARRWATMGWRLYDLAMLVLALLHGLNGLRTLVDDYVHPPRWRRLALGVLAVGGAGLMALGVWAVLAFQPQTAATSYERRLTASSQPVRWGQTSHRSRAARHEVRPPCRNDSVSSVRLASTCRSQLAACSRGLG